MDIKAYKELFDFIDNNAKLFDYINANDLPISQGIYFVFDTQNNIVRVGQSNNLRKRIFKNHFNGNGGSSFRNAVNENLNPIDLSNYMQNNFVFAVVVIPSILSLDDIERYYINVVTEYCKKNNIQSWNSQCKKSEYQKYYSEIIEIGLIKK